MDQTIYILLQDTAFDGLNITFVRTGNCFSHTERYCGNHETGEICCSPPVHAKKNRGKQRLLN